MNTTRTIKKKKPLKSSRYRARAKGYRSGLEDNVALQLSNLGITNCYEVTKVVYLQPEKRRTYTPDFLLPNGIIIETKGIFSLEDRQKHLWIKEQCPDLDIRFVFSNSNAKIRKGSKTTYAMWCEKNDFIYADKLIPEQWIKLRRRKRWTKKKALK